jgi:hypothetical protein
VDPGGAREGRRGRSSAVSGGACGAEEHAGAAVASGRSGATSGRSNSGGTVWGRAVGARVAGEEDAFAFAIDLL